MTTAQAVAVAFAVAVLTLVVVASVGDGGSVGPFTPATAPGSEPVVYEP